MIDGRSVLAVITARGGSKGLPGKNLLPLVGRPLVCWTVEAATGARCVDRTVITSDSPEIRSAAVACGVDEAVARPAELAGDRARQEDAVLHVMDHVERQGQAFDLVVLLAPTNPLRPAADIDAAASLLVSTPNARAVMTVVECGDHPLQAGRLAADGSLAGFMSDEVKWLNRQELPTYHRVCGSVCIAEWEHFRAERSFMTDATYALETSRKHGLDIDEEIDFRLAETILDSQS